MKEKTVDSFTVGISVKQCRQKPGPCSHECRKYPVACPEKINEFDKHTII